MKPRRQAWLFCWAMLLGLSGVARASNYKAENPLQQLRRAWGVYYHNGPGRFNFGLGGDNLSAMLDLQVAFDDNFAAGISYLAGMSHTGFAAAVHYYSFEPYAGFWAHLEAYYYKLSATDAISTLGLGNFPTSSAVIAISPRVGWAWHAMAYPVSFMVAVGPAMTLSPSSAFQIISARVQVVGIDFWLSDIFH